MKQYRAKGFYLKSSWATVSDLSIGAKHNPDHDIHPAPWGWLELVGGVRDRPEYNVKQLQTTLGNGLSEHHPARQTISN